MKTRRRFTQRVLVLAMTAIAPALGVSTAAFAANVGESAPNFEVKDATGKLVKLGDFKGKHVVLEWTNPECPFVQKHYGSQNMQGLQKEYTGRDVAWLTVSSTARSDSEYIGPAALNSKYRQQWGSAQTAILIDELGAVGRAYGAKTTPHMYVIDPSGKLVYAGGIDDKRSSNPADIPGAKNFVRAALTESLAGKPVSTPTAAPYGCSIKYAS